MSWNRWQRYSIFAYAWRRWTNDVTPGGKFLLLGVLAAGVGSLSVAIPVYQIFFALAALLMVSEVTGVIMLPRVSIRGKFPEKVAAGEIMTGDFTVTNCSWRPVLDLMFGFYGLPRHLKHLSSNANIPLIRSKETQTVTIRLQTLKRGIYELPKLRAFSTFPFNLNRRGATSLRLGVVTVLPAFSALDEVRIPSRSRYQPGGIALTSHVGGSTEYIGNREYVPGEPARRLDFRSWARLGRPVVREYQEEYYCRIALIMDTHIPPDRRTVTAEYPELESAVSLSAAIADELSWGEYIIELFAAGPNLIVFRSGRHTAHLDNVMEILAGVEACYTDPFEEISPALVEELERISTVVCVFLDWDKTRDALVQRMVDSGCHVKLILIDSDFDLGALAHFDSNIVEVVPVNSNEINNGELTFI